MKKITATLLILVMMFGLFAACSSSDTEESAEPTVAPEESVEPTVEPSEVPEESDTPEDDNTVDEGPGEAPEPAKTEFDADLSEKYNTAVDASRTEDQKQGTQYMTSADPEAFPDYEAIMNMLGFSSSDVEAYSIGISLMNVHAYCVAAVKPVEGSEQKILDGFAAYKQQQYDNFTEYLADQQAIAEAGIIETLEDGTILFVMTENQQSVFDGIAADLMA